MVGSKTFEVNCFSKVPAGADGEKGNRPVGTARTVLLEAIGSCRGLGVTITKPLRA